MTYATAQNITMDMVKSLQIYENYQQCYPSTHLCKILLNDDRTAKKAFYGPKIYVLIQAIAKEKISFKRSPAPETLTWNLRM